MTHKLTALVPLAALAVTGCNPVTSDLIELSVNDNGTVEIDTICSDPCLGDYVPVEATFEEHIAVDIEAELSLLQYKVEYTLIDSEETIEFYADTLNVAVISGTSTTFDINLAAESQRAAMDSLAGDDLGSATATVTFAGYDHRDELLQLSVDVPAVFGRYDSEGAGSSSQDTEVTQ